MSRAVNNTHLHVKGNIYTTLKQEIFNCILKPGDVLVIESLCKRFGISRTPVREALLMLCSEGLLEAKQRFGFIVTFVNIKEIIETYNLRIILEKEAVRLATKRMNQDELNTLKALIYVRGTPSGRRFHSFVAASSGWGVLAEMLETLMDKSARSRSLFNNFQKDMAENDFDSRNEHTKIYQAMSDRNEEEAIFLMENHLKASRDYILRVLTMF